MFFKTGNPYCSRYFEVGSGLLLKAYSLEGHGNEVGNAMSQIINDIVHNMCKFSIYTTHLSINPIVSYGRVSRTSTLPRISGPLRTNLLPICRGAVPSFAHTIGIKSHCIALFIQEISCDLTAE